MVIADEIIVLHYTPYGEKSVILHTLSRSWARRSFIVKDARKWMPYFQPLNILTCDIAENPKSQLFSAKNFSEAVPLSGIRCSMGRNAISMFMAEVLYRATREGTEEPGLYEWCRQEILILESLRSDYANFHILFLLDFAAAMGFSPSFENLLPFMDEKAADIRTLLGGNFAESMLVPMNGEKRNDICAKLLSYLEFHLETPLRIRSLSVLAELF